MLTDGRSTHALDVDPTRAGKNTGGVPPLSAVPTVGLTSPALTKRSTIAPILYSRKLLTERRIAGIRVALVMLSLVAAWLYPIAPAELGLLVHRLLGAYAVYS